MNKHIIREDTNRILNSGFDFNRLYGRTVLISGANGYVPAYFVHTFLGLNDEHNAGIRVIALCRNAARAQDRFTDYIGRNDFKLLIQDVCEPVNLEEEIHFFIHAAGPAGTNSRYIDTVNTFGANVFGAKNMLELAAHNPCEGFLLISSIDVYGDSEDGHRWLENESGFLDSLNIRNTYSCAKRAAETLCIAYKDKYSVPVTIVRPVQIIGPGPELNDGRLHIDFVSQIMSHNKIILKSDGSAVRSFLYITDAIIAMLLVMLNGESGEAYNISDVSGEASVLELAKKMSEACDREIPIEFDMTTRQNIEVTFALSVVISDSTKLIQLGWKPEVGLLEACSRMLDYYEAK